MMSEMKHTSGPWHITNHGTVDAADRQIASIHNGGIMNMGNARLIAAAPDLLEALKRMIALDPPLTGNPSHSVLVKFWQSEKEQGNGAAETHLFALAAIAAATGATP